MVDVAHSTSFSIADDGHVARTMGSIKQKPVYHWWHMKHVDSTYDLELDRNHPCSFVSRKIDLPAVDDQSK